MGGAAAPIPKAASSKAKAEYVLAVLEEVAQDVNNKVRVKEDKEGIIQKLLQGGHQNPHAIASAVLGPAAALVLEMAVELSLDPAGNVEGLAADAERSLSGGSGGGGEGRLSSLLSFKPQRQKPGKPHKREGKLFLFRDRVLVAKTADATSTGAASASSGGGGFTMLLCWPLDETQVQVTKPAAARGGGGGGVPSTSSSVAVSATLTLRRGDERVECGCDKGQAEAAAHEMARLHLELAQLKERRGNAS